MSDVRRTTIRERRQITLPAEICRELGINVGDDLSLEVRDGAVIATPSRRAALDALAAIQKAFQESGITEEGLLEEGRRVRKDLVLEVYGRRLLGLGSSSTPTSYIRACTRPQGYRLRSLPSTPPTELTWWYRISY